jgi:hypothetical protein
MGVLQIRQGPPNWSSLVDFAGLECRLNACDLSRPPLTLVSVNNKPTAINFRPGFSPREQALESKPGGHAQTYQRLFNCR